MAADPSSTPVRLTDLDTGDRGRLHAAELADDDREMLNALGLAEQRRFRLCQAGNPWIVQVNGTRVGLSEAVARHLLVIPEGRTPEGRTPEGRTPEGQTPEGRTADGEARSRR